jgi:hypothetical protein
MAVRDQVMSSTERAPEPTMEEILASIRRIISDDESSTAKQQRTPSASQPDEEGLEGAAEGEADDKIINDIARVLSGSASAAEEEEDILDLTAELGGLEPVELEQPLPEDAAMEEEVMAAAPPEMFQPAPAEAVVEPVAEAPAPELAAPPPPPMSASEEAASALERAIAALRAGHVPTSVPEFMPKPEPAPEPVASAPQPEPESAAEPEPQPEPVELILTEIEEELIIEEPVALEADAPSEPEENAGWESETAPWVGAPEPLVEPERYAVRSNGGSAHGNELHDIGHKTLEDSVKDMLRPMLRQWLDENMARVLTSALKDELKSNPARFQRD